ncbi:MAG: hypothetical protein C3F13_06830 [Anaerolineales bacterium]|nr:response regulator transcription factor [Anaerolineae bacterium]PWB54462.1 MAG: hypothetical protein C3F13_06830 [Anaerolineales bacterium]
MRYCIRSLGVNQLAIMRIFLACMDEGLRLALLMLIDHEPGMVVIGMSDRMRGLLNQLEGSQPDVLLLACEQTDQLVIELLSELQKFTHSPKIVMFSRRLENKEHFQNYGVYHFIDMDKPPDELLPILRCFRDDLQYSGVRVT